MNNRIPEELIEKIRTQVDIVDIIGEYVQLKKQGRNYFGLCPFHGENTPSFSVAPDKQIYHCFGCGAGGNVISFLMNIEGLSFTDSVKQLSLKTNVDISSYVSGVQTNEASHVSSDKDDMVKAHQLLKKFYHHLLVNTKEGEEALQYLLNRGFSKSMIDEFEIGFALPSRDMVVKFLSGHGFSLEKMYEAGLITKREAADVYFDRFRNRIMFPIHDAHGSPVAFSGRIFGDGEPKYLNSPETKLFNKRKIIYNFHNARLAIRQKEHAVLMEGFVDVISSVSIGVTEAVATMGTSLTDEQAKAIRRTTEQVIICYDGDQAGLEATVRAAQTLQSVGCTVRVATLPEGFDPDDYIRKYGGEKFVDHVIGAHETYMSFMLRFLKRRKNLQDEGDRIAYIEEVIQEISKLTSELEHNVYIQQLAKDVKLSEDILERQLKQVLSRRDSKSKQEKKAPTNRPLAYVSRGKLFPKHLTAERFLLAHMMRNADIADRVKEQIGGAFSNEYHKAIVTYLYSYYETGHEADISSILQHIKDDNIRNVASEIAMMSINEEPSQQELSDYMKQVHIHHKMEVIKEKEDEKRIAERESNYVRAAEIAMEIIKLKQLLKG
ncbi:DNA primase [Bacillus sp. HMF5848]|uniref:DNA primase n=1 Tax=Bacillus sp. HMF5848 TaxID=2495421 RepID=UPI000F77998F|nr:DNA primase [Bacillus sp. HMF5848]RSK27877.1 DNA primase [Bacillus sp. HMF5848]